MRFARKDGRPRGGIVKIVGKMQEMQDLARHGLGKSNIANRSTSEAPRSDSCSPTLETRLDFFVRWSAPENDCEINGQGSRELLPDDADTSSPRNIDGREIGPPRGLPNTSWLPLAVACNSSSDLGPSK
jgi:hypothetical protein